MIEKGRRQGQHEEGLRHEIFLSVASAMVLTVTARLRRK
jgi:hypothetical protein